MKTFKEFIGNIVEARKVIGIPVNTGPIGIVSKKGDIPIVVDREESGSPVNPQSLQPADRESLHPAELEMYEKLTAQRKQLAAQVRLHGRKAIRSGKAPIRFGIATDDTNASDLSVIQDRRDLSR